MMASINSRAYEQAVKRRKPGPAARDGRKCDACLVTCVEKNSLNKYFRKVLSKYMIVAAIAIWEPVCTSSVIRSIPSAPDISDSSSRPPAARRSVASVDG